MYLIAFDLMSRTSHNRTTSVQKRRTKKATTGKRLDLCLIEQPSPTWSDASGNGRHATLSGAACTREESDGNGAQGVVVELRGSPGCDL